MTRWIGGEMAMEGGGGESKTEKKKTRQRIEKSMRDEVYQNSWSKVKRI